MEPRPLNATAASLLGFLHEGPQSGWDLINTAEMRIGAFWSLTRSQVYRELASMAEQGLIVGDHVGPRERRPYQLTDAGRRAFRDWLAQDPGHEHVRFPLLLTLVYARHLEPGRLADLLAQHRAIHAARLAGIRQNQAAAQAAGATPVDLITLAFGLRYEAAVIDWFDHLPPELTQAPPAAMTEVAQQPVDDERDVNGR